MQKHPRLGLRIGLFKVSEQFSVSEVLQARGVIGHSILRSWDVVGLETVAMESLVLTGIVAQVGGSSVRGDGSQSV